MEIAGSLLSAFLIGGLGLAPLVGTIFLQIYLSRKENKWLGLILPIISFLFSILIVLNMVAPIAAFQIIAAFIIINIPTAILMLIYDHTFLRKAPTRDKTGVRFALL